MKKVLFITLLTVAGIFAACRKDADPSGPPATQTGYWADGRKQHYIHGNVKTVRESYNNRLRGELEFDNAGRITAKKGDFIEFKTDFGDEYYTYDHTNRLKRIDYKNGEDEFSWNFYYDSSHEVFIPTDLLDRRNPRFQTGLTSFVWDVSDEIKQDYGENYAPCEIKLVSAKDGQLVFDLSLGFFTEELDYPAKMKMTVDYRGDYPVKAEAAASSGEKLVDFELKYNLLGIPTELREAEYIYTYDLKDGFCVVTGETWHEKNRPDAVKRKTEYQYNAKGYMSAKIFDGKVGYSYEYEYDSADNWTKRTTYQTGKTEPYNIFTREYIYW